VSHSLISASRPPADMQIETGINRRFNADEDISCQFPFLEILYICISDPHLFDIKQTAILSYQLESLHQMIKSDKWVKGEEILCYLLTAQTAFVLLSYLL